MAYLLSSTFSLRDSFLGSQNLKLTKNVNEHPVRPVAPKNLYSHTSEYIKILEFFN